MFANLPTTANAILDWTWEQFEPYYQELITRNLNATNISIWLHDWTRISDLIDEIQARLYVATTRNTTDQKAEQCYNAYLQRIYPSSMAAEQELREKLLNSKIEPEGFAIPLRAMRAKSALYCEANLPLFTQECRLINDYNKIIGAQAIEWEGKEITLSQLQSIYRLPDRQTRERAWQLASQRQLQDRETINTLWGELLNLRRQIATNADMPGYREFCWQQLGRFDYTPDHCFQFHQSIEDIIVPAAQRIYERRRRALGTDSLRPWDVEAPSADKPVMKPFTNIAELESKIDTILHHVDLTLGNYFTIMREEGLLDLDNRKGKAPGAYCMPFYTIHRPFIFMNAVGVSDNVRTLLHEAGHSIHVFESCHLPYRQQRDSPMEFNEVASMAMELLAAPYLSLNCGGFYTDEEVARERIEHLENIILFWPYMAVVDAFQHWVYTNPVAATNPANCDAQWAEQWRRFMPGIDWSGLDAEMMTGWHRKLHIFCYPFYYVEYGLAQLGAVQVWRNACSDQANAVAQYRKALALGGTVSLPQLYHTAGAKFAFDQTTLQTAIDLLEQTIAHYEGVLST